MKSIQESYGDPSRATPRIVHLGLGGFHRAHQAWYTARAADAGDWGIHAFTGRSRELADRLSAQDGLYTLVTRDAGADRFEIVDSIVRVGCAADTDAFTAAVADPATEIVTLTITEAGYAEGLDALRDPASTALGRLAAGLVGRRRAGGRPLTILSCDNVPQNGRVTRDALAALLSADAETTEWMRRHVTFPSSSVDRITPRVDASESVHVERVAGWRDTAPVVTEPFSDWVIAGEFAAGRPAWETAGVRFVADVEPWERRKLWLLNGAHTILAAAGTVRGLETVAEAIADPAPRAIVERFWDEASRHLPDVDVAAYRVALLDRFANPRIAHRLAQINEQSETKARLRLVPVALAERAAGRSAEASARAIAAWISFARLRDGRGITDLLVAVSPELAADTAFRHAVETSVIEPHRILNEASA